MDGHQLTIHGTAAFDRQDGRTLWWNDAAWGYLGEPAQPHQGAEKVAPYVERDRCGGAVFG